MYVMSAVSRGELSFKVTAVAWQHFHFEKKRRNKIGTISKLKRIITVLFRTVSFALGSAPNRFHWSKFYN